jgi:glycosyltransferase involved in cell wall biosynthesis
MDRIPATPPVIHALPESANRPLWSVMIPVYNCAEYLPETLESVLQQQFPARKMQIEVVDDASTDADVKAMVKKIGKGRISYHCQPGNVGSLRNFETCLNRSRGRLIHLLHGDDKVRKGYYAKMETLFVNHPEAGAAFCRYNCITENGRNIYEKGKEMAIEGILTNWLPAIAEKQRLQYAAITVRREVYEKLGAFYGITYGEDWEMWVRIAKHFPVAYTPEILADYRHQTNSISNHKFLTADHLRDLEIAMHLIQLHLPEELKEKILSRSKKYYACYGLKIAAELWNKLQRKDITEIQVKQALSLYRGPILYWLIAKLYVRQTFSGRWKQALQ